MPSISSKENRWGLTLSLVIALLAGGQWLVALSYSRGYDFFLWLYNAWLFNQGIASGNWIDWSSFSAAGQPAFKMAGVIDAAILGTFNQFIGLETGTRVYAVVLYLVAGMGMYSLACDITRSALAGVVASAAYSLSWFLTFTAYYQSYLSNFLTYALMPWAALFLLHALMQRSRGYLLATALILFVSVVSNAQLAVKVVLFIVPLSYVILVRSGKVEIRFWLFYSTLLGFFALWWSSFLIAPALQLRSEVLLLGEARGNAFIAPWLMLFWIPLYGLNFVFYWISGISVLGRDFLAWAVFSDYIGLSTLCIAMASIYSYRVCRNLVIRRLWALVGCYFLIYFAVVPNIAASAWIGRTHNWAILPTLILALLAGFGATYLTRFLKPIATAGVLCALLVFDLGGVSFFLNRLALTHTPLESLPEVAVWKQLHSEDPKWNEGTRYFTYNPDHTFYLLPVLMQKPVANIIELRTRNWEYDSYLVHQRQQMRAVDPTYNVSESLALLDAEYVDLARKLYDYRGDGSGFESGMAHLIADENLEILLERKLTAADLSYDAYSNDLDLKQIVSQELRGDVPSQVVFRNHRHLWGFVAEETVLILGPTREGQRLFEEITHLPGYRADRILFVLSETWDELDDEVRGAFTSYLSINGQLIESLPHWSMDDINAFYRRPKPIESRSLKRVYEEAERAIYQVEDNKHGAFLFISRQRFSDWHAYTVGGSELAALKAGAGLTALYLPAGIKRVEYRYVLPNYEWVARFISLSGLLFGLVWWLVGRRGRIAKAVQPQYAER
jgi:hypothetical protein